MHLAVMVGKFVKQVVREWCPSATGPLLPIMTDSLLASGREVLEVRRCCTSGTTTSAHAKNKNGPKPGEHVQIFHMKRDNSKSFYFEKC